MKQVLLYSTILRLPETVLPNNCNSFLSANKSVTVLTQGLQPSLWSIFWSESSWSFVDVLITQQPITIFLPFYFLDSLSVILASQFTIKTQWKYESILKYSQDRNFFFFKNIPKTVIIFKKKLQNNFNQPNEYSI